MPTAGLAAVGEMTKKPEKVEDKTMGQIVVTDFCMCKEDPENGRP